MIVLDASVVVDLLLDVAPAADAISARLADGAPALAAPHLLDAEVAQVLRRLVSRGTIEEDVARDALADLADLPLIRYPHLPLIERAFDLRANVTVYDALYLVLAEVLEATLLTRDGSLLGIPDCTARVEVVR